MSKFNSIDLMHIAAFAESYGQTALCGISLEKDSTGYHATFRDGHFDAPEVSVAEQASVQTALEMLRETVLRVFSSESVPVPMTAWAGTSRS